jgi:hypothetical protein
MDSKHQRMAAGTNFLTTNLFQVQQAKRPTMKRDVHARPHSPTSIHRTLFALATAMSAVFAGAAVEGTLFSVGAHVSYAMNGSHSWQCPNSCLPFASLDVPKNALFSDLWTNCIGCCVRHNPMLNVVMLKQLMKQC